MFRRIIRRGIPILVVSGARVIGSINEFIIASVFLTQSTAKTLAVGMFDWSR